MSLTDYYHIKLELYPTSDPLARTPRANHQSGGGSDLVHEDYREVWRPTPRSNIFDELPSHPRRSNSGNTPKDVAAQTRGGTKARIKGGVLDHGTATATGGDESGLDGNTSKGGRPGAEWHNAVIGGEEKSFASLNYRTGLVPKTAIKDWRFGKINIESFDLARPTSTSSRQATSKGAKMAGIRDSGGSEGADAKGGEEHAALLGPNLGGVGSATKAKYIPLEMKNTEAGWGIVHLYKESVESASIAETLAKSTEPGSSSAGANPVDIEDEDGTILCITSVPGYISPTDFLSWVGDKWRGDVSHYRMVMTSTTYRYMVLMKLKSHTLAVAWQKEFAGKPFPGIQPELCQVAFIKSITVETPGDSNDTEIAESSKSQGKNKQPWGSGGLPSVGVVGSEKPFPPPTPDLTELPTCSVCLERMDNTAGLVTIPCQHIFHCTCLQTWKGSGCPICRATTPATRASAPVDDPNDPLSRPFGTDISNICYMCNWNEDLWICLICGNVGCGRYRGGHAKEHWKNTAHSFSLELETQYVWDYASDSWVHRLLRNKDEKVVELPSMGSRTTGSQQEGQASEDVVPRVKLENLSVEYSTLYTKQLESQRIWFEDLVNKARDKAAQAAKAAEQAASDAQKATQALSELREEHRAFREKADSTISSLEKDLAKEKKRAEKSAGLARGLATSLQEEKEMSKGLLKRVQHLEEQLKDSVPSQELASMAKIRQELEEEVADLRAFITGSQQVEKMKEAGEIDQSELDEGSLGVQQKSPQSTEPGSSSNSQKKRKGKGKGKAKK